MPDERDDGLEAAADAEFDAWLEEYVYEFKQTLFGEYGLEPDAGDDAAKE